MRTWINVRRVKSGPVTSPMSRYSPAATMKSTLCACAKPKTHTPSAKRSSTNECASRSPGSGTIESNRRVPVLLKVEIAAYTAPSPIESTSTEVPTKSALRSAATTGSGSTRTASSAGWSASARAAA